MAKRKRVRVGDVFEFAVDEDRVGYGQVVATYREEGYYFAIFDRVYPKATVRHLADVVTGRVAFLTLSLDAKLHAGHWLVRDNLPVSKHMPLPAYKEGSPAGPSGAYVVDYSGKNRRPATALEAERLPYRAVVAPVRLERAFRALHGVGEWDPQYDELRPAEDGVRSEDLFR